MACLAILVLPALASAEEAIAPSARFTIEGAVKAPVTYGPQELAAEPTTTATVFYSTGHGPVTATFKGVQLWTLLQEAGIATDPAIKNDILRFTVTVVGTDGYTVALSAGELAPNGGAALAIIAYEQDGKPLDGATGGFARLVMPNDKNGGRNVASVATIEVGRQ